MPHFHKMQSSGVINGVCVSGRGGGGVEGEGLERFIGLNVWLYSFFS